MDREKIKMDIYDVINKNKECNNELKTWEDIQNIYNKNFKSNQCIFRGHNDANIDLITSFEKCLLRNYVNLNKKYNKIEEGDDKKRKKDECKYNELKQLLQNGLPLENKKNISPIDLEKQIIKEFQRKTHNIIDKVPNDDNLIEWMALLKHFEGPSRLLDWTYSFWVALYFAIEYAESDYAVFAINTDLFKESLTRHLGTEKHNKIESSSLESEIEISKLIKEDNRPIVYHINPFYLNNRVSIQQGTFLCQSDIKIPFEDNILENIKLAGKKFKIKKYIYKFDVNERRNIIKELYRMNISRFHLFQELEAFGKYLGINMMFHINK